MKRWMSRRASVVCAGCAAMALVLVVSMLLGVWKPMWMGPGRFVAGLERGRLELALSDSAIKRDHGGWLIKSPVSEATLVVDKWSVWGPRVVTLSPYMFIAGAPKASTLTVVNVPLWTGVIVFGLIAGGIRLLWARRLKPGRCGGCGYDLAGLAGETCPECGAYFRVSGLRVGCR